MKLPKGTILHLYAYQAFTPEIVYLASRIKRTPYVVHLAIELEAGTRLGILLPAYKRFILRQVLCQAATVQCQTEDWADFVVSKYGVQKSRTVVIPPGTKFNAPWRPKSKISTPVRLLFVGRLTKQKNVPMLLEAMRIYKERFDPEFRLKIVGDGELREDIMEWIEETDLADHVSLSGPLFGGDLQNAYEESDIFVLPTLYESFGVVFIEAMAKGLPIVTTNVASVRNVVVDRRNGLLTDTDAESFCLAIRALVTDASLYSSISATNLEDVGKYDWDRIVDKVLSMYKSLAF
jgi:glycosyltransferase involved in cell wall biosynthesis